MTQIPWALGKCLTWDVMVTDTLAASHLQSTQYEAGSVAEEAARRKEVKYSCLPSLYSFVLVAFETLGPVNLSGSEFIDAPGSNMISLTGDLRERTFLWQHLSMALQRFNAVCYRGTFRTLEAL